MLAVLGLGAQEVVLVLFVLVVGVLVVATLLFILAMSRSSSPARRLAELEEENRRLRAELEEKRKAP